MNTHLRVLRMSAATCCALLGMSLLAPSAAHGAEAMNVVQGQLLVMAKSIEIDRVQRVKFEPAQAQCFDHLRNPMQCATLVGIGYVDDARVTLRGDSVVRIDIISLQQ